MPHVDQKVDMKKECEMLKEMTKANAYPCEDRKVTKEDCMVYYFKEAVNAVAKEIITQEPKIQAGKPSCF